MRQVIASLIAMYSVGALAQPLYSFTELGGDNRASGCVRPAIEEGRSLTKDILLTALYGELYAGSVVISVPDDNAAGYSSTAHFFTDKAACEAVRDFVIKVQNY